MGGREVVDVGDEKKDAVSYQSGKRCVGRYVVYSIPLVGVVSTVSQFMLEQCLTSYYFVMCTFFIKM